MMIPTVDHFEQTWLAKGQFSLFKLGGSGIMLSPISAGQSGGRVPQPIESDV